MTTPTRDRAHPNRDVAATSSALAELAAADAEAEVTAGFASPLSMSAALDDDRSRLAPVLTVLVVLLLTLGSVMLITTANDEQERVVLDRRMVDAVTAIDRRMSAYVDLLYGVRGLLARDSGATHAEFAELVRSLDVAGRYPGVQAIGGAVLVEGDRIGDLEREIDELLADSGLGYPTFEVRPATDDVALPIAYLEPVTTNERSFGFDLWSEPTRRSAAERARDTGEPVATGPVTLVQETGDQLGFHVMLPVYRRDSPVTTVEERRDAFIGVAFAAFRMGDLMEGVIGSTDEVDVLEVYDHAAGTPPAWTAMYASRPTALQGTSASADSPHLANVDVAGRTWTIYYRAVSPPLSAGERALPVLVMLGGAVVAALLGLLVRSVQSARRRALRLAMEMTGELKALTSATQEAIVTVDAGGCIVSWNRGATEAFGYTAEEMLGVSVAELMPADRREKYLGAFTALMGGDGAHELTDGHVLLGTMEITGLHACGVEFPIELSVAAWESSGRPYATGFMRDISERRRAEERLRSTTELLTGVFRATTELALIATDVDGTIVMLNSGAERMLGTSAADVVGRLTPVSLHDWREIVVRAETLGVAPGFDALVAVAARYGAETRRWTYAAHDGRRIPVEVTVTPMHGTGGEVDGFIFVGVDVTERNAVERAQHDALEREREVVAKLRELDAAKSDFVSTMSHELRTPLTSIIGFTELLIDRDGVDASELRMLETVERNAQRLLLLVEDLLTLSRIEAGGFEITRAPLDPATAIEAVVGTVRPMASGKEIAIDVVVDGPERIVADRVQFERVLLNLLSNAVKFTPNGGSVSVRCGRDGDDAVVAVADTGLGIPADEIDQLFSRFFRTSTATAHAIQGTGLGLVIVQNIVEQHGGTITVDSVEGEGSTFTVRIPVGPDPHVTAGVSPQHSDHPRHEEASP